MKTKTGKLRWRNRRANHGRKPAKSLPKGPSKYSFRSDIEQLAIKIGDLLYGVFNEFYAPGLAFFIQFYGYDVYTP